METLATTQSEPSDEITFSTTTGSLMLAGGQAFAHVQRVAKMFSSSTLVPDTFKGNIANCTIALEMAHRMGANPMAVMQNLYIVHGRPGWSAQFIIACLNQCGKFSPLRFKIEGEGDAKTCTAWAKELDSGEILEGPGVSIGMAKKEGWATKNGSKWQTMPDLMLRYRAATFFGRLYAPDLLMGMVTAEELSDATPVREVKGAVVPFIKQEPEALTLTSEEVSPYDQLVAAIKRETLDVDAVLSTAKEGGLHIEAGKPLDEQPDDVIADLLNALPQIAVFLKGGAK